MKEGWLTNILHDVRRISWIFEELVISTKNVFGKTSNMARKKDFKSRFLCLFRVKDHLLSFWGWGKKPDLIPFLTCIFRFSRSLHFLWSPGRPRSFIDVRFPPAIASVVADQAYRSARPFDWPFVFILSPSIGSSEQPWRAGTPRHTDTESERELGPKRIFLSLNRRMAASPNDHLLLRFLLPFLPFLKSFTSPARGQKERLSPSILPSIGSRQKQQI